MFGLFKKKTFEHPVLGILTKSGPEWSGKIEITPGQSVPIELDGTKDGPRCQTLDAAQQFPAKFPSLKPQISPALVEHLQPYQDALSDPDHNYSEYLEEPQDAERILAITSPDEAWQHTSISGLEIGIENSKVRVLIQLRAIWDPEHTLGAFFDDWEFMELNGSV